MAFSKVRDLAHSVHKATIASTCANVCDVCLVLRLACVHVGIRKDSCIPTHTHLALNLDVCGPPAPCKVPNLALEEAVDAEMNA